MDYESALAICHEMRQESSYRFPLYLAVCEAVREQVEMNR